MKAMVIQTNPQMFRKTLAVHTLTHINQRTGVVTLRGSDGTSIDVSLDSWGPFKEAHPPIGSEVQSLPE
jgi:hypothetical protein